MFGKKESIFDKNQNQQLKALIKNQTQIIKNQNLLLDNNKYWIKNNKTQWSWLKWAEKKIKSLESTIIAMKQRDEEFAKMFQGLASLSASKAELETVTVEG